MSEETPTVTVSFLNGDNSPYFEFRPQEISFRSNKNEFDSGRAVAGQEVRDVIQPLINAEHRFSRPIPCHIKLDGKPVKYMIVLPDSIRISRDDILFEFRDPIKFFRHGDIDISTPNKKARKVYGDILDAVDNSNLIFNGYSLYSLQGSFGVDFKRISSGSDYSILKDSEDLAESMSKSESENNVELMDTKIHIDLSNAQPIEALRKINDVLGMEAWVSPYGVLKIGNRETYWKSYLASPDDTRVLKMSDHAISAPRNPVRKVVVRGGKVDEPGESIWKNSTERIDPIRKAGWQEFVIEGVAVNENIEFGETLTINDNKANGATLESRAFSKLIEEQRDQWSGTISINPKKSGTVLNDVKEISIGDLVSTVPPDETNDECWSSVWMDTYRVTKVAHEFEGSHWTLDLEVVPLMDDYLDPENITTKTRHYDPGKDEYMDEEEYRNKNNENIWDGLVDTVDDTVDSYRDDFFDGGF